MKDWFEATLLIAGALLLVFWTLAVAFAFYTWPCEKLRTTWWTRHTQAPARCIG